jgi:hypothetical protein
MPRPKGLPRTGGRKRGTPNKATADVKALASVHAPEAIGVLVAIMNSTASSDAARVAAARDLLDRAFGRAHQRIEATGKDGAPIQSIQVQTVDGVDARLLKMTPAAFRKIAAEVASKF